MRVPATWLTTITLTATSIRITPGAAASLAAGEGEDPVGDGLPSPRARTRTAKASGRDVVNDPRAEKPFTTDDRVIVETPTCDRMLQMFLWIFALHHSLHHPPGPNFVPEFDTQVRKIPACNKDEKERQHFSRPDY